MSTADCSTGTQQLLFAYCSVTEHRRRRIIAAAEAKTRHLRVASYVWRDQTMRAFEHDQSNLKRYSLSVKHLGNTHYSILDHL